MIDATENHTFKSVDKYLATLPLSTRWKYLCVYVGDAYVECFNVLQQKVLKGDYSRPISRGFAVLTVLTVASLIVWCFLS